MASGPEGLPDEQGKAATAAGAHVVGHAGDTAREKVPVPRSVQLRPGRVAVATRINDRAVVKQYSYHVHFPL
jgi:hypothetical protein